MSDPVRNEWEAVKTFDEGGLQIKANKLAGRGEPIYSVTFGCERGQAGLTTFTPHIPMRIDVRNGKVTVKPFAEAIAKIAAEAEAWFRETLQAELDRATEFRLAEAQRAAQSRPGPTAGGGAPVKPPTAGPPTAGPPHTGAMRKGKTERKKEKMLARKQAKAVA
jgi:hypothetical protein